MILLVLLMPAGAFYGLMAATFSFAARRRGPAPTEHVTATGRVY
jgi:hypothetical protein